MKFCSEEGMGVGPAPAMNLGPVTHHVELTVNQEGKRLGQN